VNPKTIKVFGRNIRAKLVFVYVIFALLCAGFVFLAQSLFSDFRKQQEKYHYNTEILLKTNVLVSQFYRIQEYANLFLVQKETRYLKIYQTEIDTFQQKLKHIVHYLQHDDENDIFALLNEKKVMMKKLQLLFVNKKDIDNLYTKIADQILKETDSDTLQILETAITMTHDTVWQEPKNFRQRLRDAFRSSKKSGKKIATVSTLVTSDTLTQTAVIVTPLLDSLYELTKQYQYQYNTKIERIEIELYALLTADQFITKEITTLLLQLHEDMLLSVISLGKEYEKNAYHALNLSIIAGAVALLLITIFIIFIFRNIRTIKTTHEALRLEKQKTEELMEHRHQLLLSISHDIKTPLNALLGYLELWENETLSVQQLRELNTMQYSGKYILSLLNNLLEFTRLEQQKSQIVKDNIEIVPFFMEIAEMFQPLCNEKNNKFNYFIHAEKNPQILTDSLKLKQIIVNLISNAVKYTTKGKISVSIEEICEPKLQLKIIISDTGKGIPKEKLSSLFEPFTRVEKNSAGIEGSGLGLFVVKGLVNLLRGEIEIHSEENRGTTVTLFIPFENVMENDQPVTVSCEPMKIWVIEDDITQLQMVVSMLEKLGHTTISSTSKETFADHLQTDGKNCNLVFTDLEMGDLHGYEVLQKIKSQFDIPVICLSGNTTISKTELQQLGFDDFLEKPFALHQLEKILSVARRDKARFIPTTKISDLFSLHDLNDLFDNDIDTINTLLSTFTSSLPNDIQKFKQGLAEKNLFLIQQTAHRLLPFCKQISANEVVPILEKIELSRKETNIQFNDFETDIILLINNLQKLLLQIQNY
jgi:signal transduction histidine kinase/CheY-like chemotaxis protein/HPt (histidine-containing phosphotransfer) domain-containing protein